MSLVRAAMDDIEPLISNNGAPVGPAKGPLPRAGEEYSARDHALRAVESVDGATTAVGDDGSIASAVREMRQRAA